MAVVYSKVLLFDPPLIYTAPDICVFGAVLGAQVLRKESTIFVSYRPITARCTMATFNSVWYVDIIV